MRLRFSKATLAKVVAFTVASIALTVGLAMKIANVGLFGDTYALEAEFANASGVFEGDAVKLAGVDVGRVTGTEIEDGVAVVTFDVDDSVRLTTETRVGIRWRNVIGLRFLYLYPGTGGEQLGDGDRITLSNTEDAGDIGAFLNHLGPILQAIDPEKANAFIDAVNTALVGNEATVRALFTDAASLAGELGDMDAEIQSLIGSSDKIMAAYAGQHRSIESIIDSLDEVGGELSGMTDEINSLLTKFAVVQDEMARLLTENRGNIDATISNLNAVARTLALNRKNLSRTLCTLPAGVMPYDQTSSWGEWFNVRIVELVFKDQHGNIVSSQSEEPVAGKVPPPYTCGGNGDPNAPAALSAGAQAGASETAQPRSLGGWIDSLLEGGGTVG